MYINEAETFWIAHGLGKIEHGVLPPNVQLTSGLEYFETYTDPRKWAARINLLERDYAGALKSLAEVKRLENPFLRLADYRWRKETGGIELYDGVLVSTTRDTQTQISKTLTAISLNMVNLPIQWKTAAGWLSLDIDQFMLMAKKITIHVDACFRAERAVSLKIGKINELDVISSFDSEYKKLLKQLSD
jgi:hypothetical protein